MTADPPRAPERGPRRRVRLRRPTDWIQRLTLFLLALGFYLLLGELTAFDLATGAVSAIVVVAMLSRVTFTADLAVRRTVPRLARGLAFVPALLWEIVVANAALALVLLDPRLPIDPSVETLDAETDSDLERAVLANSITLTPGTLALSIDEESLVVHTLTESARDDLLSGGIRDAIRRVFHGREDDREGGAG